MLLISLAILNPTITRTEDAVAARLLSVELEIVATSSVNSQTSVKMNLSNFLLACQIIALACNCM